MISVKLIGQIMMYAGSLMMAFLFIIRVEVRQVNGRKFLIRLSMKLKRKMA